MKIQIKYEVISMLGSEANISNKELKRAKIRERYKGSDNELLEVIPGKKVADFYDDVKRRVAVYVRVSTDNLQQTSSYELQKNYYEEKVSKNPNWTLVDIYADATVIIGLKQNPTHGRRFSPIFLLKSGILWGKTQNATTKRRKTEYGMG